MAQKTRPEVGGDQNSADEKEPFCIGRGRRDGWNTKFFTVSVIEHPTQGPFISAIIERSESYAMASAPACAIRLTSAKLSYRTNSFAFALTVLAFRINSWFPYWIVEMGL